MLAGAAVLAGPAWTAAQQDQPAQPLASAPVDQDLPQAKPGRADVVGRRQPPPLALGRPDCTVVLRTLHDPKVVGHSGKRTPNPIKVATLLGTDADWVERCAASYGRRIKRREDLTDRPRVEGDSQLAEKREAEEFDELSHEEIETQGDKYFTVIENDDRDRKKLSQLRELDDLEEDWEPDEHRAWLPYESRQWQPSEHVEHHPADQPYTGFGAD